MRTLRCDHPGCSEYADYKVAVVSHAQSGKPVLTHRWLCAQHYTLEKQRSNRYEYNIVESIPDDPYEEDYS
jgi:hypothetical protein